MDPVHPAASVRVFVRVARWVMPAGSADWAGEAGLAFASLYRDARRRGRLAAGWLWIRAIVDLCRVAIRARRPASLVNGLADDVRWSLRMIRKRPVACVVVVASIGVAVGATTAAFSVINAFMWRSWGSSGLDRVVRVREDFAAPGQPPDVRGFTLDRLGPWQRENTVFEGLAAGTGESFTLLLGDRPERVAGGVVSHNFFDVLGIRPALGRVFTAAEDAPGRSDTVLLGDALWRSRFAADPAVVGRSITLNGRPHTVVGVMPRGLRHPYQSDLWVPLGYREDARTGREVYAPARLKPGVSLDRANAEMDALASRRWTAEPSPQVPRGAQVTPLRPEMLGPLDRVLYALAAAAALVLLIATANVSNLLLAHSLEQGADVAVRTALGASRLRLVRQFLTYSVMLAAAGAIAGVLLTFWSVAPLVALSPLYGAGEFDIEPRLDWPTLLFTAATAIIIGIVFGWVPALQASRSDLSTTLRATGRSRALSRGPRRWLTGLVVAELALAFVLMTGAAVLGQGLLALTGEPWGVDRRGVTTFDLAFPSHRYPDRDGRVAFTRALLDQLRTLPDVAAAGATTTPPFYAGTEAAAFNVEGGPAPNARGFFVTHSRVVTPGYFEALGIPITAGRDFSERDTANAPAVVIVSQSLAARYWPRGNAVGQRLKRGRFDGPNPWMEVIGVAGSIRENGDTQIPGADAWYLPYQQPVGGPVEELTFAIKGRVTPPAVAPIRAVVARLDPEQPIANALTLDERFARFTATERLTTGAAAALGAAGLILAGIGIYAVLAFSLQRRLPELGVRAALGARPADVRALVVRETLALVLAGGVAGGLLAVALLPVLDANLFASGASLPAAFAGAIGAVALVALAACIRPALLASRVNPLTAMRP